MKSSKTGRLLAVVVAVAACFAITLSPSEARPAVCAKLERQLASAGGSSGGAKFSNAARSQAQQLQIARSQARRAGCSGSFFSAGGNTAYCGKINSTVRRMEANLSRLQNRVNSGGSSLSKARIRAALDANDCYRRPVIEQVAKRRVLPAPARRQETGLLTMLFGGEEKQRIIEVPVERSRTREDRAEKRRVKVLNLSEYESCKIYTLNDCDWFWVID